MRRPKANRPVVFTIGHSTHDWEEFVSLLRAHQIQRIVDVRTVPRSRFNPQFNRETMARKLRSRRIGYVHLRRLGGLRHPLRDSKNTAWRNASFRGFADYMQTLEFRCGFDRLLKLAREKRSALMCAEAVPWRCHRSLIADALVASGVRVEHITSRNGTRPHGITPFARVRSGQVIYPAA